MDALKAQGRAQSGATGPDLSGGLVIAQVALSCVLVVVAGLLVQTFARLTEVPLGFDAKRVLILNVNVNRVPLSPEKRPLLYQQFSESVATLPGVARSAASVTTPLNGSVWGGNRIEIPEWAAQSGASALVNFVTPGWFDTYGTPIRAGRDFDAHDAAGSQPVAAVNEAFVRQFVPDRSALGLGVMSVPSRKARTIVGIVADSGYRSIRDAVQPTLYIPLLQFDWVETTLPGISLSVRAATGSPTTLVRSVADRLATFSPDLSFNVRLLDDQVQSSLVQERLVAGLSGFFGTLALLLAGIGLYGVTAYTVSRRRGEIGIRLALGAAPARVLRLALSRASIQVGVGMVVGGLASLWATRFVASLLFGVEPHDPDTLIGAVTLTAAVAILAAGIPAWRASRIDPAAVLRES
jgi:predicted permease